MAMLMVVGPAYGACLSRPGHDGAYYRYRIVDHQRCWYAVSGIRKGQSNQIRISGRFVNQRHELVTRAGPSVGRTSYLQRRTAAGGSPVRSTTNQRRVVHALYPMGERGAAVRQHYRAADTHHPRTRKAGEADNDPTRQRLDNNTEPRSVTVGADIPPDIWTPAEEIEMRWPL